MERDFYNQLADQALNLEIIDQKDALNALTNKDVELIPLLNAAYEVRKTFVGKDVSIHIINNAQNGFCPEDCHYCAQAKSSEANIEEYPIKSDDEIMLEAKNAYEKGAHRYCMVFAGRGPSSTRTNKLADLIKKIKSKYPLEICVSAGLLDTEKAKTLKQAGLDRLNHNLNTSEKNYPKICTTHTYQDRLNTLQAAKTAGLQLCSGIIMGMGEVHADILDVAYKLRDVEAQSIPVNFLIPIEGNQLNQYPDLTPEYCLRALCLFRFINPKAEIRMAAGRELHLRDMEVLGLYPANSLFLDGYLNTKGAKTQKTLQMIKDAGFTIKSDHDLDELLVQPQEAQPAVTDTTTQTVMKGLEELRPHATK